MRLRFSENMNGSDEEDNNPFSGTNHLYASGIAAVVEGTDDYDFSEPSLEFNNDSNTTNTSGTKPWTSGTAIPDVIDETDEVAEELDDDSLQTWRFASTDMTNTSAFETSYLRFSNNETVDSDLIKITDAGQYRDINGKYAIGYKVKFGNTVVTRRYSEFDSLRQSLVRLLPTVIIPPIPSKHPIIKYLFNPLHAKKDVKVIEKRQRLLMRFLNNCYKVSEIRNHIVFQKFLNPEYFWKEVLGSAPVSILPQNNLLAPPLNPTKPSPLHLLLPLPTVLTMRRHEELLELNDSTEVTFSQYEAALTKLKVILQPMHRETKTLRSNIQSYSTVLSELGAYFNAFSLENSVFQIGSLLEQMNRLSVGIEKVGQAIDVNYVSAEILSESIVVILEERTQEMLQFIQEAQKVLRFRHFKQEQFHTIDTTIKKREQRIESLRNADLQALRLDEALKLNAESSPTVAQAMESLSLNRNERAAGDRSLGGIYKTGMFAKRRSSSELGLSDVDPHLLNQEERQSQVRKLEKEIEKLNECYKLIEKDLQQVNESTEASLKNLFTYFHETWQSTLREMSKRILSWLKDCAKSWRNAREAVISI